VIKEAIEKIQELCEAHAQHTTEMIDGRLYTKGPKGYQGVTPPQAQTIKINTLTGIADYSPVPEQMIHVIDHKTVNVVDKEYVDKWLTRSIHVIASHESPVYQFGQFYDVESFIIAMQSMFDQDASDNGDDPEGRRKRQG